MHLTFNFAIQPFQISQSGQELSCFCNSHIFNLIEVDKMICIILPSMDPISPYIYEYSADTRLKKRIPGVLRYFQVIYNNRQSQKPNILQVLKTFYDFLCSSNIFLPTPSQFYNLFYHYHLGKYGSLRSFLSFSKNP